MCGGQDRSHSDVNLLTAESRAVVVVAHADTLEAFSVDHIMLRQNTVSEPEHSSAAKGDLVVGTAAGFWLAERLRFDHNASEGRVETEGCVVIGGALTHGLGEHVPVLVLGSTMVKNLVDPSGMRGPTVRLPAWDRCRKN